MSAGTDVRTSSIPLSPPTKARPCSRSPRGWLALCYLGDDIGDLPPSTHSTSWRAAVWRRCRAAVSSEEAPPALLDRADVVVDGPKGALDFLENLL